MNSLDSAFCRRCGAALDAADVQVAREKLVKLIEQGNTAYNEGRIDEALEVAETALTSDPSSTVALALKMNCLERRDRIAEALECAERIVELNPDSELDKIKRNQLRRLLEATARDNDPGNRRLAILGAISAVLLFATIGSYLAIQTRKNEQRELLAQNEKKRADVGATDRTTPVVQTPTNTNPPIVVQPNPQPQGTQPPVQQPTPNNERPTRRTFPGPEEDPGGTLPVPSGSGLTGSISVKPITPPAPTNNGTNGNGGTTKSQTDTDPKPMKDPKVDEPAPKPQGTMELTIHGAGGNGAKVGSEPANDAAGQQALLRTAMSQYQAQNYGPAARAFERALAAGADPTTICERLGQCYEQLGKKSDAMSAYNRGLKACTEALSAGRGDKEKLTRKADLYRSHLQVVGG